MPVRCRDDRFAGAKGISQRARRYLRLIKLRSNVEVRAADELLQWFQRHVAIVKNNVPADTPLLDEALQLFPVSLPFPRQQVRMRGTQDDIDDVRVPFEDCRKRFDDMLDALVWRKPFAPAAT